MSRTEEGYGSLGLPPSRLHLLKTPSQMSKVMPALIRDEQHQAALLKSSEPLEEAEKFKHLATIFHADDQKQVPFCILSFFAA